IFDRKTKLKQRNWAAAQPDFDVCQYVKDEIGYRVADKVFDLTKFNDVVLDLGCGVGHIGQHLIKENVGVLIQCDMSEGMIRKSKGAPEDEIPTLRVIADEEKVPFKSQSIDLIVTSLSAHWINDLPGWFQRCFNILRPDGAMIGALLAGDTLYQLRVALQLAENERLGGMGTHISPFIDLRKDILIAADSIYRVMYGSESRYPATFQIYSFIGWRPGQKGPKKAAKRGSQNVSLKDLSEVIENPDKFVPSEKN
uniref:Methyltransferase type 11 domain-containing protein n=1 Tax=Panagrolaimus sp. ES5 TaxID=591445 RepID=A0AC34GAY3_9BILA